MKKIKLVYLKPTRSESSVINHIIKPINDLLKLSDKF